MSSCGQGSPESGGNRVRPTWRVACIFSLLALLLAVNLTRTLWTVSGPRGVMLEFVLKSVAWLYVFGLCGLSMHLGVGALKASRHERDRAGARWSIIALIIAVLTIVLTYHAYRVS